MNETQDDFYIRDHFYDFYGVDGNHFKLDDTVFLAVEDEHDGYRSMLETVRAVETDQIFARTPLSRVLVTPADEDSTPYPDYKESFSGYRLVDTGGHTWLRVGTENYDDYYPTFIFEYTPKSVRQ